MRQPHKNLFFSYRGAQDDAEQSELVLDRQLEDNTTKALVFVLENANRETVLAPFLRTMAGLDGNPKVDEVQFVLQRVDIHRPTVPRRVALSIAPVARSTAGKKGAHQSGRPDAWIWVDGSFAVLLENKVRGAADEAQIDRHVAGAEGWTGAPFSRVSRGWSEVYDFFSVTKQRIGSGDTITRLLVNEFVRYLRMVGLGSETTFDLEDFGYFLLAPEDRDATVRAILARKLTRFTQELSASPALRPVMRYYGTPVASEDFVSPGVFRKEGDQYWITIGPKERRDRSHFTVRLTQDGIALEAFSPHRSFTTGLLEKIQTQPAAFLKTLSSFKLGDPYHFRLREAHYHDPTSSYKGQRISSKIDFLQMHPALLSMTNLSTLIVEPIASRLELPHLRPEIFLVRYFQLSELLGRANVVDEVARAAEPMLPYLEFALKL